MSKDADTAGLEITYFSTNGFLDLSSRNGTGSTSSAPNSGRHNLELQMGTNVAMLERHYSKLIAAMAAQQLA